MTAWFVVQTKPRQERRAERGLRSLGLRVYLPRVRYDRRHHRSKGWIRRREPLFPGYLFIGLRNQDAPWYDIAECRGVVGILGNDGVPMAIQRETVAFFMRAERRRLFDQVHVARETRRARHRRAVAAFPPNSLIRITDGPFSGLMATVERIIGSGSISVMLDLLGRLTPVEFDPGQLERLDAPAEAA